MAETKYKYVRFDAIPFGWQAVSMVGSTSPVLGKITRNSDGKLGFMGEELYVELSALKEIVRFMESITQQKDQHQ